MDSALDRPEERKAATVWGQLLNVMVAGFFLAQGICQPNPPIRWTKLLLAVIFAYRACTYRPSRLSKEASEAVGLAYAVVMLVILPLLTLAVILAIDGCNTVLMWGVLLLEIIVPGFFIWRYFRARKS